MASQSGRACECYNVKHTSVHCPDFPDILHFDGQETIADRNTTTDHARAVRDERVDNQDNKDRVEMCTNQQCVQTRISTESFLL